jgi:radical SAM superfamily enzyme
MSNVIDFAEAARRLRPQPKQVVEHQRIPLPREHEHSMESTLALMQKHKIRSRIELEKRLPGAYMHAYKHEYMTLLWQTLNGPF